MSSEGASVEDVGKVTDENEKQTFKKPLLIGKVGHLPRKVVGNEEKTEKKAVTTTVNTEYENLTNEEIAADIDIIVTHDAPENAAEVPYKEPPWSGLPQSSGKDYCFEVLKSGSIIGNINLMEKAFWTFGRLGTCDICLAHPTVSRYHAVLQYRGQPSEDQPAGFYLYDLASTHGTFLNKNRLKSRLYIRVQVGHMIKFGCSSRSYLLTGPDEDTEEESELSMTELKKQRAELLLKREEEEKEAALKEKQEQEAMQKKLEEKGVDWGMGEDAEEESDLTENPYAQTNNEELYLDDPKKALRGFMEREGYDFEYNCSEQGMGQFLCKVELPLDDERGRPIVAEVLHKGKKKEAVVQCALEACRILDRHGLLRQATHESRKRKAKNWEENDYYDSDDDTFLDRTGTIEKKRESRMKLKVPQQPETYQTLIDRQEKLKENIKTIEKQLSEPNKNSDDKRGSANEQDSLDSFMQELKHAKLDKQKVSRLKTELSKLKVEYMNVVKLVNIARPANMPALTPQQAEAHNSTNTTKSKLPLYGKRLKVKVQLPVRPQNENMSVDSEEDEDDADTTEKILPKAEANQMDNMADLKAKLEEKFLTDCNKIERSFKKIFPLMSTVHENNLTDFWEKLKMLHGKYMNNRKKKAAESFDAYVDGFSTVVQDKFTNEIKHISDDIKCADESDQIITLGRRLIDLAKELTHVTNKLGDQDVDDLPSGEGTSEEELEKRKKKNQRRIQQRQEKAEVEKQRGYQEDASKEDYNMWVPPRGQTGDGRTSLNDKLGY